VQALSNSTVEIKRIQLCTGQSKTSELNVTDLVYSPHRGGKFIVKLTEDYLLSLLFAVLSIPVLILIAVAIKLDSRGPVFFTQYRNGLNGVRFKVYKFRTMDWCGRLARHPNGKITRVGRFLRRTSLDELPQLFNVLKGEMSLVGPRPHATFHYEHYRKFVDLYMRRHLVKPGLTGWAQVNGLRGEARGTEDMKHRTEFDLHYIEHWSIWFDIKIMLMTPLHLMTHT